MAKKSLAALLLAVILSSVSYGADPFYVNLLNEGKQLYTAGKFDDALENFKIAEFGLIDEKDYVPELYFYYALAYYRKGALAESKAMIDKMKMIMAVPETAKLARPKEIERDLSIMVRALDYLSRPGVKPGSLAFFNLFYDTWDLLKAKKLELAEANIGRLEKMNGDEARLRFLEGYLAFQKGEHKKCINRLEKVVASLGEELGEDAQFYLAYCQLRRGNLAEAEKFSRNIRNPEYVHQLMALMEEIKTANQEKGKK